MISTTFGRSAAALTDTMQADTMLADTMLDNVVLKDLLGKN